MVSLNTIRLLAGKLNLNVEEDSVIKKAAELLRLLNAKSTSGNTMSDTSKVVICLDLAASLLGTGLDHKVTVKYSGLKPQNYANCKKIIENLLEINNDKISVSGVCLALQCGGMQKLAERLLDGYEKCLKTKVDLNLPQYACMAVYQACRLNKVKISKSKIIEKSRLKLSQWSRLDAEWTEYVTEKFTANKNKLKEQRSSDKDENIVMEVDIQSAKEEKSEPKVEPYEDWKRRMLEEAYKELKELDQKEKTSKTEHRMEAFSPRRSPRKTPQKFTPYKCQKSPKKNTGMRLLFPSDL